jgi:hypothetical protein
MVYYLAEQANDVLKLSMIIDLITVVVALFNFNCPVSHQADGRDE